MRILGLDVGSKTIGVAISDPLGWTAQGITTIRRKNKEQDIEVSSQDLQGLWCGNYSYRTA